MARTSFLRHRWLVGLVTAPIVALIPSTSVSAADGQSPIGTVVSMPVAAGGLDGVVYAADGGIWTSANGRLARLDPGTGAVTSTTVTDATHPYAWAGAPTSDGEGGFWFADSGDQRVGHLDASGTLRWSSTAPYSAFSVIASPDGSFWFFAPDGGSPMDGTVGHMGVNGVVSAWQRPMMNPSPPAAVASDEALWFWDDSRPWELTRITPSGDVSSIHPAGYDVAFPHAMASVGDHVYVSDTYHNALYELDLEGAVVASWPMGQDPQSLAPGSAGVVYVADLYTGALTAAEPSGATTTWSAPGGADMDALAYDPNGYVWAVAPGTGSLLRFTVHADGLAPLVHRSVAPSAPDGAGGWYRTVPRVTVTCTDSSGLALCPTSGPAPQGRHPLPAVATDAVGNSRTLPMAELAVDSVPPQAAVSGVDVHRIYVNRPPASCTATDASSGVASCTLLWSPHPDAPGTHTVRAQARDRAGNVATSTPVAYVVGVRITMAFVGTSGTLRAGHSYRLAVTLTDAQGHSVDVARVGYLLPVTTDRTGRSGARPHTWSADLIHVSRGHYVARITMQPRMRLQPWWKFAVTAGGSTATLVQRLV